MPINPTPSEATDAFPALRALTEALLTRADADYLRRQIDAAVKIMAARGCSPPVPWPDESFGVARWGSAPAPMAGEALKLAEEAKDAAREHASAVFGDAGMDRCCATWDALATSIDRLTALAIQAPPVPVERERLADSSIEAEVAAYQPPFRPDYRSFWRGVRFAERAHSVGAAGEGASHG